MTTLPDSRDLSSYQPIVNYDEPPVRPPPILLVGPLAWIRQNLFSSWFDAILTIVGTIVIVSVIGGLLSWIIGEANWFAIMFNLRNFMLGRFEAQYDWRVNVLLLLTFFAIGLALAAWARISRTALAILLIILALVFILPPIINMTTPLPPTYLAAGQVPIPAGSDQLLPQEKVAFIARSGDKVTLQVADDLSQSDSSLSSLAGFGDDVSNQLRNSADTRLSNADRAAQLEVLLAGDLLTAGQRLRYEAELKRLTISDPITDIYALNQAEVNVQILQGTDGTVVGEGTISSASAPLEVTLPADGWYVLQKTVSDDKSDIILQTQGIYPILTRNVNISTGSEDEDQTTGSGIVPEFVRMTDNYRTFDAQPLNEAGKNIPTVQSNNIAFRGTHRFSDYLSLFVGPFLGQINVFYTVILAVLLLGYAAGNLLDRYIPNAKAQRGTSRKIAGWLLMALPIIAFGLVYGTGSILPLTNTQRWGGLLLTLIATISAIIFSFPIGILLALGRRSTLPAVSLFCTVFIEFVRGVPFITILFMSQLLVPLVNPALASMPGIFRAIIGTIFFTAAYLAENVRGGLQAVPHGQEEAAKALGLGGWQITLYITLPQALRVVIPALVGMCIALFMDTSLFVIVGLLDLVGIANNVVVQSDFLGDRREVLVFITVIYFTISYAISMISRKIEASGAGKAMARKI